MKSAEVSKFGVPFSPTTVSYQVVILFGVVSTIAKKPPISFVVSVLVSACINLDPVQQIGVKIDIGDSYENLQRKSTTTSLLTIMLLLIEHVSAYSEAIFRFYDC